MPARIKWPAIRRDGREIFWGSDRAGTSGALDIWSSTRRAPYDAWSAPIAVEMVNSVSNDIQPAISSNGRTMILTSNRPGGLGLTDLYVSTRCVARKDAPRHAIGRRHDPRRACRYRPY